MTLIVTHRSWGLMVHHQAHTLGVSIVIEILNVEIRIRSLEIEHIVFAMTKPVFPTNVPALDKHLREAILGSEIDIFLYILCIGRMLTMRLYLGIISLTKFDRRQIECIRPLFATTNHLPPNTNVLNRLDPWSIWIFARLIQIENKARGKHLACIIHYHDGTPWSMAWGLHVSHVALCIWSKLRGKHKILVIQIEMHTRKIHQSSLMDIEINTISCLHLQWGLHTCRREDGLRSIAAHGSLQQTSDFWKLWFCIVIFLSIVITRNPPCLMVTSHGKLSTLCLYYEIR